MNAQDWEFLYELMLSPPRQPAECRQLVANLQQQPHDRALRGVVADWFYEHGYDACSQLIRRGYTPGGQNVITSGAGSASTMMYSGFGPVGGIASGSPPPTNFASGLIGGFPIASGTISINQLRQMRTGTAPSAYEEFHS